MKLFLILSILSVSMFSITAAKKVIKEKQCWIISNKKNILNIWEKDFSKWKIKCSQATAISKLDGNTELSEFRCIILDTPKIQESFARKIENWVKNGGILIVTRMPSEYLKISISGKKTGKLETIPWIQTKKTTRKRNTVLRATSVADFGQGKLLKIEVSEKSPLLPYMNNKNSFAFKGKNISCKGLDLVTGWPNRKLGNMSLIKAELEDLKDGKKNYTVATCHKYGRGIGIVCNLPLYRNEKTFIDLRNAFAALAANFKPSQEKNTTLFSPANAPGQKDKNPKEISDAPQRPEPPKDCALELQGDLFSGSIGSPAWAPWRVALATSPQVPIRKTFKFNFAGEALWMKVKAAYGDHTDAPIIEVKFNKQTLIKTQSPWNRIQYNPKYYDSMYPVWIYVPKELVKKENTLSFINHGPDWWLLDYVQFYKAEGNNSVAAWRQKAKQGEYEAKAIDGNVEFDGKLDEKIWKKAYWENFDEKETGKNPTSFALANGKENLFIAFKCPYDKKSKLLAENNVLEFAAAWPGAEMSYIFSYSCDGTTSLTTSNGDAITGSPHKGTFFDDKERKLITVEMAIPWGCLPIKPDTQIYYPAIKRFLPEKGIMSINVFRRISIKTECFWLSWLPFMYKNKMEKMLKRAYLTRTPYNLIYTPVKKGTALGLPKKASPIKFPQKWEWGINLLELKKPVAKVELRIANKGKTVYSGDFSGTQIKLPLVFPGENNIAIKIYDNSDKLSALSMRSAKIHAPCKAMSGKTFYTTEKTACATLKVHNPEKFKKDVDRIEAEMLLPDGKTLRSSVNPKDLQKTKNIQLPFEISSLPCGFYKVKLSLMAQGEKIPLPDLVIKKLPKAATEVKLRADGTPEINGKAFFPFGICLTAFEMHDSPKAMSEAGINMIIPWEDYDFMDKEKWDKFCDEALKENIYLAIHATGKRNGAGNWLIDYDKIKKYIKSMKNYKPVIGYYPIDEPEYWHAPNCTPKKLKEFNEFINKQDPYRPTMISHAVGNIHYEKGEDKMIFNNVVDIRIWECYKSPKHVIERMDEVNSTGKNDRAAAWAFLRTGPGWGFNGLSPKAFRANAYAAVISGAKGILYFEMRTSRWSGHELWPDVFKKVSEEIQSLATSFMKESSQEIDLQIIEGAKLSRAKAWKDGNKIYLAIVNANENKDQMKIKFPLAVKGSGKALFEDMPDAKLEDEYISVNLEPEDVGVYTLSEK